MINCLYDSGFKSCLILDSRILEFFESLDHILTILVLFGCFFLFCVGLSMIIDSILES